MNSLQPFDFHLFCSTMTRSTKPKFSAQAKKEDNKRQSKNRTTTPASRSLRPQTKLSLSRKVTATPHSRTLPTSVHLDVVPNALSLLERATRIAQPDKPIASADATANAAVDAGEQVYLDELANAKNNLKKAEEEKNKCAEDLSQVLLSLGLGSHSKREPFDNFFAFD